MDGVDPVVDPGAVIPTPLEFERYGGSRLSVAGRYKHLRWKLTVASSSHLSGWEEGTPGA